jgi:hypothetical protein
MKPKATGEDMEVPIKSSIVVSQLVIAFGVLWALSAVLWLGSKPDHLSRTPRKTKTMKKLAPIAKYGITILASLAMVSCAAPDSAAGSAGIYYATCSCKSDPCPYLDTWPQSYNWTGPHRKTHAKAEADASAHTCRGGPARVVGPH